MTYVNGVNLLPATGEFTYDTVAYRGQRAQPPGALLPINAYANQAAFRTDMELSVDQLLAAFPGCATVAIVCAWFFNSETAGACQVYPSTTYVNNLPGSPVTNAFQFWNGTEWANDHWRVSASRRRRFTSSRFPRSTAHMPMAGRRRISPSSAASNI